ncbi:patatin-like phospholipase family protein [Leptothrix discophora]|uniref:Patatin-like phospholipase family protein n=1 Tax=Leptothrix discophora TaxID=89 RepID=A0ABT9G697_LEPDI|nr:patatin-like phospholipase family protein [Leptothrix discophora]MDP4302002.1 patatin-like phospholipase family protein [Leptothrix discophora]
MNAAVELPAPVPPVTGLLLTGGGARAAYQVGVLEAVMRIARECKAPRANPFQVITGTSAGAINAAALACRSDDFAEAVAEIADLWRNVHAEQVYRADSLSMIRTGAPWLTMMSFGWAMARWRRVSPKSLLDNSPLQSLLHRLVPFERLPMLMSQGHLHALAVTASSYSSGQHVTFYEAEQDLSPWTRSQRIAVRTTLNAQHLLASSAIPFVFPAIQLPIGQDSEWFGDGSMRQAAPISPAVHLGAERVLIVGAGRMTEPLGQRRGSDDYPSVAQIAGHALSNIFLDALAVDVERLQRINSTLALLPPEARARTPLRPIEALVISPSQRLDDLAAQHVDALPMTVRTLLRGVGVNGKRRGRLATWAHRHEPPPGVSDPAAGIPAHGGALSSYLLFESAYTRALISLGQADTLARRQEVIAFFGWQTATGTSQREDPSARRATHAAPSSRTQSAISESAISDSAIAESTITQSTTIRHPPPR